MRIFEFKIVQQSDEYFNERIGQPLAFFQKYLKLSYKVKLQSFSFQVNFTSLLLKNIIIWTFYFTADISVSSCEVTPLHPSRAGVFDQHPFSSSSC